MFNIVEVIEGKWSKPLLHKWTSDSLYALIVILDWSKGTSRKFIRVES